MRKTGLISIIFFVLVMVLSACGSTKTTASNSTQSSGSSTSNSTQSTSSSASNSNGSNSASSNSTQTSSTTNKISGTLNFYTSEPDADAAKLVQAFNKKYPDVKVKTFRSGTEQVVSKIEAEKQAGNVQADVLLVADSVTFDKLKNQNLLLPYASKELSGIPSQFVDPDHTFTGTKIISTALAVNTNKVKQLPDSWKVLTSSQAKNQVVMPSPLYSGAAAYNLGVFTRMNGFGWDFYKGLKQNNVMITQGNGAVLKAVESGQKSYGMVVDFIVARAEQQGSPVKLIYPKEGVPAITEPIGILKNAQNKPAAKAFVDFALSQQGQEFFAQIGYTPVRKGVKPPAGLEGVDQMKVLSADLNTLYKNQDADKKQFATLFGK